MAAQYREENHGRKCLRTGYMVPSPLVDRGMIVVVSFYVVTLSNLFSDFLYANVGVRKAPPSSWCRVRHGAERFGRHASGTVLSAFEGVALEEVWG